MIGHSIAYYLGKYWSGSPLYKEKLIPLMDYALSSNYVYKDKLADSLNHVVDKYKNTAELPIDELRELVKESGYEYILDLLNNQDNELKVVVYLIVLIHQLKGSEKGIRLVLSLFQELSSPEDTKITQWYETIPVGKENTFSIEAPIDISKTGLSFYKNFEKFIKNYVYPELAKLSIGCSVNAVSTPIGYSKVRIHYGNVARDMDN